MEHSGHPPESTPPERIRPSESDTPGRIRPPESDTPGRIRPSESDTLEWVRSRFRTFDRTLDDLDETYTWAGFLKNMIATQTNFRYVAGLQQILDMPSLAGITLTGPPGTGKHTLAQALAGELGQTYDFQCVHLTGQFLNRFAEETVLTYVDRMFEMIPFHGDEDMENALCLWLEDLTACRCSDAFAERIADHIRDLTRAGTLSDTCFVILLAERENQIPDPFRRLLMRCECRLPDLPTRKRWLELHMKSETAALTIRDLSTERIAAETEGMSFRQLTELMFYIKTTVCYQTLSHINEITQERGVNRQDDENDGESYTWDLTDEENDDNDLLMDQLKHASFTPIGAEVLEMISLLRRDVPVTKETASGSSVFTEMISPFIHALEENQKAVSGLAVTIAGQLDALRQNGAVIPLGANVSVPSTAALNDSGDQTSGGEHSQSQKLFDEAERVQNMKGEDLLGLLDDIRHSRSVPRTNGQFR